MEAASNSHLRRRALKQKLHEIGSTRFIDGSDRGVFEDADGRQFVEDDRELVAGQWLPPHEPAVIEDTCSRNLFAGRGCARYSQSYRVARPDPDAPTHGRVPPDMEGGTGLCPFRTAINRSGRVEKPRRRNKRTTLLEN